MRYFLFCLLLIPQFTFAQLINSLELTEKIEASSEKEAKKELLHLASLKSIEKFASEMGYKFDEFSRKLNEGFSRNFEDYKEKKLVEKFGSNYKQSLSEQDKAAFLSSLEKERHDAFIKYARTLDILRSHSISATPSSEDPNIWNAKVEVNVDKIRLERLLRRVLSGENKRFPRLILISEIQPLNFGWNELGLESDESFLQPLNESWLKWQNENLPSSVEEAELCDSDCQQFYSKWSETSAEELSIPAEYTNAVLLKVNLHVRRTQVSTALKEATFEWEGWALLQDINTKRVLASFALGDEKRTFREMDQKALNSALASSIYRSPMSAFLNFKGKLEEKMGFNRVEKLVIQGARHMGDVTAYVDLLKTRGSSLGLDVFIDSFRKDQARLACYYRGEEKSFTDLLSAIKELKSSHSYTLVNDFTGSHNVIKFVPE